jgi:hypothetical protein
VYVVRVLRVLRVLRRRRLCVRSEVVVRLRGEVAAVIRVVEVRAAPPLLHLLLCDYTLRTVVH